MNKINYLLSTFLFSLLFIACDPPSDNPDAEGSDDNKTKKLSLTEQLKESDKSKYAEIIEKHIKDHELNKVQLEKDLIKKDESGKNAIDYLLKNIVVAQDLAKIQLNSAGNDYDEKSPGTKTNIFASNAPDIALATALNNIENNKDILDSVKTILGAIKSDANLTSFSNRLKAALAVTTPPPPPPNDFTARLLAASTANPLVEADLLALYSEDKTRFESNAQALKNIADRTDKVIFADIKNKSADLSTKIGETKIANILNDTSFKSLMSKSLTLNNTKYEYTPSNGKAKVAILDKSADKDFYKMYEILKDLSSKTDKVSQTEQILDNAKSPNETIVHILNKINTAEGIENLADLLDKEYTAKDTSADYIKVIEDYINSAKNATVEPKQILSAISQATTVRTVSILSIGATEILAGDNKYFELFDKLNSKYTDFKKEKIGSEDIINYLSKIESKEFKKLTGNDLKTAITEAYISSVKDNENKYKRFTNIKGKNAFNEIADKELKDKQKDLFKVLKKLDDSLNRIEIAQGIKDLEVDNDIYDNTYATVKKLIEDEDKKASTGAAASSTKSTTTDVVYVDILDNDYINKAGKAAKRINQDLYNLVKLELESKFNIQHKADAPIKIELFPVSTERITTELSFDAMNATKKDLIVPLGMQRINLSGVPPNKVQQTALNDNLIILQYSGKTPLSHDTIHLDRTSNIASDTKLVKDKILEILNKVVKSDTAQKDKIVVYKG
jgi:hypothetical protein